MRIFAITSNSFAGNNILENVVKKVLFYWKGRPDHEYFYSHKTHLSQKSLITPLIIFTLVFFISKLGFRIFGDILFKGRVSRKQFDGDSVGAKIHVHPF